MTDVWGRWALVQWGSTMRYGSRRGAELALLPAGEGQPVGELYYLKWLAARSEDEAQAIVVEAAEAWATWVRRPEPPPQGETLDELKARVLAHDGWSAKEVALALRCTPTFVRRVREEAERNADTGRVEGSMEHIRELIDKGCTLRQVAMLTGIPKSTISDALARAV